jgi:hypothetical protein
MAELPYRHPTERGCGSSPRTRGYRLLASFLAVVLAGLLVIVGLVAVPYLVARSVWRIHMPPRVRIAVVLAVPSALVWWLATSPDFADITAPGAALLPLCVIAGWLLGTACGLARLFACRLGVEHQWDSRESRSNQSSGEVDDTTAGRDSTHTHSDAEGADNRSHSA